MANVLTVTYDGERWDNLAFRAYGDGMLFPVIMAANPGVGIRDRLMGGMTLVIPVLASGQPATTNNTLLPPWAGS